MHSMQTTANSKFYCHVFSFLHVACCTSKLLCCKKGTMVMTYFFGVWQKFILFVFLLWVVHERIRLCSLRCCGYPAI
jgi:hypothetical protein